MWRFTQELGEKTYGLHCESAAWPRAFLHSRSIDLSIYLSTYYRLSRIYNLPKRATLQGKIHPVGEGHATKRCWTQNANLKAMHGHRLQKEKQQSERKCCSTLGAAQHPIFCGCLKFLANFLTASTQRPSCQRKQNDKVLLTRKAHGSLSAFADGGPKNQAQQPDSPACPKSFTRSCHSLLFACTYPQ